MRRESDEFPYLEIDDPNLRLWAAVLWTFFQDAKVLKEKHREGHKITFEKGLLLGEASTIYMVHVCEMLGCEHTYFYKNLEKEFK